MLRIQAIIVLLAIISSATKIRPVVAPLGIVEGITDCGSSGKLGIVEVTDCTFTPCKFIPNSIYNISIRFTASDTSDTLVLNIYRGGNGPPFIDFLINGEIQAGIEYELKFQLPVSEDLSGTAFNVRIFILDFTNLQVEVCAEASVEVAPIVTNKFYL